MVTSLWLQMRYQPTFPAWSILDIVMALRNGEAGEAVVVIVALNARYGRVRCRIEIAALT